MSELAISRVIGYVQCPRCSTRLALGDDLRTDRLVCANPKCKFAFHLSQKDIASLYSPQQPLPKVDATDLRPAEIAPASANKTLAAKVEGELSLGGLVKMPAVLANRLLNVILTLLAVAIAFGVACAIWPNFRSQFFQTYHETAALFVNSAGDRSGFQKTYLFWVPREQTAGVAYDPSKYVVLDDWLSSNFGGWTRWDVTGGASGQDAHSRQSPGYFYQVSVPASNPKPIGAEGLRDKIKEIFGDTAFYCIEQGHATPKP